jgi:hypothetical protein
MSKQTLSAYRVDLTHRVIPVEQGKSIPLPRNRGKVHRKMNRWRCGQQVREKAKAASVMEQIPVASDASTISPDAKAGPLPLRCFTRENEANRHMRQSK